MFFTIIQLIADGIEEMASLYRTMMESLAYRILKNHQDAEDAVQEALFSLSQNMDKIDNLRSKRSLNYIYTVTQNAALAILRREKRRNERFCSSNEEIANIPGQMDVEAFANQYGFGPRISDALAQLSSLDRDILCYRYGAGYTPREIAELIGESRDFVYKRMQRAEVKLAVLLTEKGEAK